MPSSLIAAELGMEYLCIDSEGDDSNLAEIWAEAVPQC